MDESETKLKSCESCARLIGVRYNTELADKIWRCGHPDNVRPFEDKDAWITDLVTGKRDRWYLQPDIYAVRYNQCKGIWYEEYVPPVREELRSIGGQTGTEIIFDDATLEANRKAAQERLKELRERKTGKGSLANINAKEL